MTKRRCTGWRHIQSHGTSHSGQALQRWYLVVARQVVRSNPMGQLLGTAISAFQSVGVANADAVPAAQQTVDLEQGMA